MPATRFSSPTQDFDLDVLVSRLRRGFLLSVGLVALRLVESARCDHHQPTVVHLRQAGEFH